ncbi:zinc-finger double domain containing protein [Dermatophagoides farinae]|uniref:Zinc-finger double domain containing protein n=1 Tax=Dermatophagoides farinae TaxID=6954 RepID=A0A9D4SDU3_DERFA|nr:zinc-finger double domain containing protein [Dermatophagoides farinae]
MDNQERKSIQNQFENNNIQDPNLCLLNLIQQQADIRFQSLLKRYENYLATAIESYRKTTTINRIDVEKFQCDWPGCIRRFQTEEILNHHRRFHIRKSNYQCKHCSLRLLDRRELLEHVVNYGVNMSIKSFNSSSTGLSSFPSSSSSLTLSIDMNDRKMLIDQLISPRMSKNRDLKKALLAVKTDVHLTYSGIGRYRCPWPDCSYTPHFLRDLRRHMFKHTGDKRYKCPQCRFVSVWKTSLLQHQRKKHSITINNVSINTNNNN